MNYVFLCIGSNRVVCDSFAPFVANYLLKNNINAYVYGTLTNPINAINLDSYIDFVKSNHFGDKIIVIDTRLVDKDKIKLSFGKGPLEVAILSLKRNIGDYFFTLDIPIKSISKISIEQIIIFASKSSKKIEKIFSLINNYDKQI